MISLCALLLVVLGGQAPAFAVPYEPGKTRVERSVPGKTLRATPPSDGSAKNALSGDRSVRWPSTAGAEVAVGAARGKVGDLPLSVGPAAAAAVTARNETALPTGRVRAQFLDRETAERAGIRGPVFRLARTDGVRTAGTVSVELDYTGFRAAYGADWAHRLRIVQVPECALTRSGSPDCRSTAVPTRNDPRAGRLTAEIAVPAARAGTGGGALFAATAAAGGPTGSYAATSLSPSSTWSGGNPTGDFAWNYPLRVPPGIGGPTPQVALAYSSSSVDGRTAATNNQPSQIGEGFDFHPGYIERRYKRCADDMTGSNTTTETGDQCWGFDNATISLNGRGGELVLDDATGTWKIRNDDGSKVERLAGAVNGDKEGQHWKVTTSDGTQYFFGLNRLPGWSANKPETQSVLTAPVYGNQQGEKCWQAGNFAGSVCDWAYRWQLDYVIDTHDNVMSYWYERESNWYAANLKEDQPRSYIRGGWLDRVDYGQRHNEVYTTDPVGRVKFEMAERCAPDSVCDYKHPENYPDVPLDQKCDGGKCEDKFSPTFWSTKRLARVVTQVRNGSTYRDVDSWTLRHAYPSPGDGTRAGLWLAGITHTGHVSPPDRTVDPISLPEVTFDWVQMSNRVSSAVDTSAPMNWFRIKAINNETGGSIAVVYSPTECDRITNRMPASEDTNTMRCMPVKVPRPGSDTAVDTDWFHKYVVTEVTETDNVGGNEAVVTRYEYLDGGAWRHEDNDGLVDARYKTWSQWRGYGRVRTIKGGDHGTPLIAETRFFRGMNGDKFGANGTRTVTVSDSSGGTFPDHDEFAGSPREEISYVGSTVLSRTVTDPWRSAFTAKRVRTWGTVEARRVDTSTVRNYTTLANGGVRSVEVTKTFDANGLVTQTNELGDLSTADDDKCIRYTYARNTDRWILTLATRIETVTVACDKPVNRPADVLSDVLNFYDGSATHGAAPTRGDVTRVDDMVGYSGGQPQYRTVGRTVVDMYGRGVESYDKKNEKTTTEYTPATGGPVTRVTTVNPLLHRSTVDLEPAWGSALTSIDPNDRRGDLEYDPLGRLVKGWSIDRPRTGGYDPASYFEYHVSKTGTATVTKGLLPNGGYVTSYELFDGLLRPRQTQVPAAGGGRVLTDTFYDTRGLAYKRNGTYYNEAAPGTQVLSVADQNIPGQNITEYDAAGRATVEAYRAYGVEKWRTRTVFQGEKTHVLPPRGSAATTVVDAHGRTVQSIQYRGPALTDVPDTTSYTYTKAGQLSTVTDPAGSVWRYHYDLRGRMWKTEDPDKGVTEFTFNEYDEVTTSKDARQQTLAFAYDRLGRLARTHEGSLTGAKRTEMVYDTLAKGYPTGSMRFVSGARYDTRVLGYDLGYRPTGTRVTLPAAEGALMGSYDFTFTYKQNGAPSTVTMPAQGGLPGETVYTDYDDQLGLPLKTSSALGYYVENTTYTRFSEVEQLRFDVDGPQFNASKVAWRTFHYEDGTRDLTRAVTERQTGPTNRVSDVNYTREIGGLITKITDTADGSGDTQCFDHDHRNRLTEAWTPTSGSCDAAPTTTALGGPAPYWTTWTYDAIGNRKSEVQHRPNGDVRETYTYPAATDPKPHTVTSVTTTDPTGTRTLNYGYDAVGNTTSRLGPAGGVQALTWDIEGQLAKVVDGGDETSFVYDAGGTRLLRKDAKGTTLFLGAMEVRLDKATSSKTATRYYSHAGQTVAVRTTTGLTWLAQDHHGTGTVIINEATQAVERRRFTPFGEQRGAAPGGWPDSKGFVGGEQDPTGLLHLGARLYDPGLGRFISVDPLVDSMDPQQMQGYSYGNNSPVSVSDPDGLKPMTDEEWYGPTQAQIAAANTPPSGGGGGGGGNSGPSQKEIDEAKRVKNRSKLDVVLEAGGEILMEVLGINDIRNCVSKGDVMACASTVANIIPWGKIFKLPKIIKAFKKAYDAISAFGDKLKAANNVLRRADEAASAAASAAAKQADEAAAAAAKQADDAAAAGAKQADEAAAAKRADEAGEAVGDSCKRNSFTPDTPVLMGDGSARPIGQVEVGDEVIATDPETGESGPQRVTTTVIGDGAKVLVDVTIDIDGGTGDETSTVTATDGHPFWLPEPGVWLKAIDLKAGDALVTPDGARVTVLGIAVYAAPATVHNLTVASVHTYFVLAGSQPVLVHNCGPTEADARAARDRADELQDGRRDYKGARYKGTTAVIGVYNKASGTWTNYIAINGGGPMPKNFVLRPGEVFVRGKGISHAEETILNGLGPDDIVGFGGTSRNICRNACHRLLNTRGMKFGGSRPGAPDKTPYSFFWQT